MQPHYDGARDRMTRTAPTRGSPPGSGNMALQSEKWSDLAEELFYENDAQLGELADLALRIRRGETGLDGKRERMEGVVFTKIDLLCRLTGRPRSQPVVVPLKHPATVSPEAGSVAAAAG